MARHDAKVVSAYGGPLSKRAGQVVPLTLIQMQRVGDIILEAIRKEIAIDARKAGGTRDPGKPVPIPLSPKFAESFKVHIRGGSTIEIVSNWPTATAHTTPRKSMDIMHPHAPATEPFEMKWLVQSKVPFVQIVQKDGVVVVRSTPDPLQGDDYWMHPGFRKYTFLERGMKKGREAAVQALMMEVMAHLMKTTSILE